MNFPPVSFRPIEVAALPASQEAHGRLDLACPMGGRTLVGAPRRPLLGNRINTKALSQPFRLLREAVALGAGGGIFSTKMVSRLGDLKTTC